jgi:predicted Fe-S protein YdhL (DUF1289 family)
MTSPVQSPCIGVCRVDAEQVCVGCGRHIDEVMIWPRAGDSIRRRICDNARQRLAVRAAVKPPPESR